MNYFHVGKGIQIFAISLIGVLVFCAPGFSQGARANSGRSPGGAASSGSSANRQGNTAGTSYRQTGSNGQRTSGNFNTDGRGNGSVGYSNGSRAGGSSGSAYRQGNAGGASYRQTGPNGQRNSGNFNTDGRGNGSVGYSNGSRAGGSSGSAYRQGNAGGASYQQTGPNGQRTGGNFNTDGRGNGSVGFNSSNGRTGYGGSIGRQGSTTTVNGEYRKPGTFVPGTQEQYAGTLNFAGRNSSGQARFGLYDATGRYRLAGADANLDRRNYSQNGSARVGPVGVSSSENLRFSGINSRVTGNSTAGISGVGVISQQFGVDRRSLSGSGTAKVLGNKVGADAGVKFRGVNTTMRAGVDIGGNKVSTDDIRKQALSGSREINKAVNSTGRDINQLGRNISRAVPKVKLPKW